MKLKHKTTGRLFTFVRSFVPQFTNTEYTVSAMSSGGFGTTHYQITTNDNRKHKR